MRVKKIVLKNLFSFNGKQEISFEKNTLVLAENGFGKTSLLNSIKLALGQKKFKLDSILNSHATDKECFIEIDFDEFILKRVWDFKENFEDLTIFLDDNILKNYEAEEFLKEKFPIELIDFIFFDGEVEKDLVLLKSNKIKRIFEYSFDLDILSNMIIDTRKIANSLSNKMGNEELVQFQNLQKNEMRLAEEIIDLEENKIVIIKEHRRINELIRLNELKIRNRSKEIEAIQRNIDENELKLFKEIAIFQEINLYQLPLILNRQLKDKVDSKNNQSIEVLDKKEFENSFDIFIQTLESSLSKSEVLKSFYQVFQMNKGILLTYTKSDLINLLIDIKNSIDKKERFLLELEQTKEKLLEKNNFKKLEQEGVALNLERNNIELKINLLNDQLENKHTEHKEVHKKLRLEFIAKRDKYAKIKAIEELYNISEISKKVYNTKLAGSLNQFNQLFSEKIKPFLETYQHIEKIYINDKFKVILEDRESRFLDIVLLSAGQKQILSFILISTVLEFKQFVDFIFIDTPFGRLSNKNRDFIFNNYYLKFSYLTLLITSSEYDYLKDKNSTFKKYTIEKNGLGSTIGVAKND